MGKITSSSTIYATAYLTEKGRTYLFNKNNIRFDSNNNDLFEIKTFTLGDPDTNYRTSQRLESGDVPDITGKSEGCLKSTSDYVQTTFTYFTVDSAALSDPLYNTNVIGNILNVDTTATASFPLNSTSDVPPTAGITIILTPTGGSALGGGLLPTGVGRI